VVGVILALEGLLVAPLIFLMMFNSIHIWVRLKGFCEGYLDGKGGVRFLSAIDLPGKVRTLKWVTTILLAVLCAVFVDSSIILADFPPWVAVGGTILACSPLSLAGRQRDIFYRNPLWNGVLVISGDSIR